MNIYSIFFFTIVITLPLGSTMYLYGNISTWYIVVVVVGLICLCRLRADKLTSAAEKPFEGISKAVCEV